MSESHVGELFYLRAAIRASKKGGLFEEFSDWYMMYREAGNGVEDSAWRALCDWDLLDDIVDFGDGTVALRLKMDDRSKADQQGGQ